MQKLLGLPPQASAHAGEIDQMIVIVHWLMLVLFVGWGAFFLFTLFRYRQSRQPRADYHGVTSHFSTYTEIGVAVIEAVLLIAFAFPAWAQRVEEFPSEEEATVVRVIGEQFAWNMHYPGADRRFGRTDVKLVGPDNPIGLDRSDPNGKDDITTINQLNLPVGRPAIVHLTSKDVIHSFGVVEARIKQDAIPGLDIPLWWVPTVTGNSEIACSQLCGLGHYRMRGFVTIQTPEEFQAWLDQEAAAQITSTQ